MAERVRVCDITNQEGNRRRRIVRRSSGSVVTWRRAQMVLLSAQAVDIAMIAHFTLAQRRQIKRAALSRPVDHDLPFSTWSLAKLADFLVAEGWSTTSATKAPGSCSTGRACPFK